MKRQCKYRNCSALLTDEVHGNAEYCPANKAEPNKMSCKAKEEQLKRKEREQKRNELYEKQMLLKARLNALFDKSTKEYIDDTYFAAHIVPVLSLFEKNIFQIRGDEVVEYTFDNYRMYKELTGDEYHICIEKQISYE